LQLPNKPDSTPKKKLLPVMMYIHGGAFLFGSGNVYLPDYFMDEDVILITMNYRFHNIDIINKILCKVMQTIFNDQLSPIAKLFFMPQ
jgi:dipeptidyl aminopeptidase/acylaminoacyl peptidase